MSQKSSIKIAFSVTRKRKTISLLERQKF